MTKYIQPLRGCVSRYDIHRISYGVIQIQSLRDLQNG